MERRQQLSTELLGELLGLLIRLRRIHPGSWRLNIVIPLSLLPAELFVILGTQTAHIHEHC
jgi:hypothetical protein